MNGNLDSFSRIAVYLKDPLVLAGFVIFIGFLCLRQILNAGIIPNLGRGYGYRVLRLTISYGFIIGLTIVLLGMGLKYRELTRSEQIRATALITDELKANLTVTGELGKNADTLANLSRGIAAILRDKRMIILAGLFPESNIDPGVDESTLTNLYVEQIEWLTNSKLWTNVTERRRTEETCAAIVRFVDRTRSTAESLADPNIVRYPITRKAFDANLEVIRKIQIVDTTNLANLYYQVSDARVLYDRVVNGTLEYMKSIRTFCSDLPPTRASLSSALALERLNFRLVPEYKNKLAAVLMVIAASVKQLETASNTQ